MIARAAPTSSSSTITRTGISSQLPSAMLPPASNAIAGMPSLSSRPTRMLRQVAVEAADLDQRHQRRAISRG